MWDLRPYSTLKTWKHQQISPCAGLSYDNQGHNFAATNNHWYLSSPHVLRHLCRHWKLPGLSTLTHWQRSLQLHASPSGAALRYRAKPKPSTLESAPQGAKHHHSLCIASTHICPEPISRNINSFSLKPGHMGVRSEAMSRLCFGLVNTAVKKMMCLLKAGVALWAIIIRNVFFFLLNHHCLYCFFWMALLKQEPNQKYLSFPEQSLHKCLPTLSSKLPPTL